MAKRQKMWVYRPPKSPKPKVPDTVKTDVEAKANALIETVLKPEHVKEPPAEERFNYIADIYANGITTIFTSVPSIAVLVPMLYRHLLRRNLLVWST